MLQLHKTQLYTFVHVCQLSSVSVEVPLTHVITFGKAGLEVCLEHDPRVPIKQLIFITNKVSLLGDVLYVSGCSP